MARRKTQWLSDGSDSDASNSGESDEEYNSQEDETSQAERDLFEHKGRKRRKMDGRSGKEAAWEGIFGEEESERPGGRGLGAKKGKAQGAKARTDWTKAPAFVSKSVDTTAEEKHVESLSDVEAKADTASGSEASSDEESDEDEDSRPPSPRVRETDDDQEESATTHRGLGMKSQAASSGTATPQPVDTPEAEAPAAGGRGGIGSARRGGRAGIGSTREAPQGGLGSSNAPPQPMSEPAAPVNMPAAFGRRAPEVAPTSTSGTTRRQQNFRGQPPAVGTKTPTELTAHEAAHFRKIESSFGAKMLANFGWAPGKGLGLNEDGRAVPVAAGKVLKGQGIARGVRTEDSKREARRKGELISDDEDERPTRRGKKSGGAASAPQKQADDGWKRQKKVRVKVEHKTYEQLLAEAGDAAPGVGLVIDARGGEMKEVSSLSALSLSSWTPTSDHMQLPELRHNLRLVADAARIDVDALAKEGRAVNERSRWALREEAVAQKKVENADILIKRLDGINAVVQSITAEVEAQMRSSKPSLDSLTPDFQRLMDEYRREYVELALDEVIVGAVAQILRPDFQSWQPFDPSSDLLLAALKPWKKAFRVEEPTKANTANVELTMTAWESFIWTLWMPKVRSVINNEWKPHHPQHAVHLIELWESLLPPFVTDNVLDQLIMPKVKQGAEEWDPRRQRNGKPRSLAGIIFPWLPLLGDRVEEVLDIGKRRIKSILRSWTVRDGIPEELPRWKKDIYSSHEWDKLMLQYVVPKLGNCLRDDFTINPRKQELGPLVDFVLPWHTLLRPSVFAHLLEVEFFPKWLEILYIWLVQPNFKADEVANWFTWWKDRFPSAVLDMNGVTHGFKQGLDLMQEAMKLGSEAPSRLRKPVFQPLPSTRSTSRATKVSTPIRKPADTAVDTDVTFRSLAEDFALQRDLIFLPLGRSHGQTGKPLFRVAKSLESKGVILYVGDNAVFAQTEDGTFRAISLEEMAKRAGV